MRPASVKHPNTMAQLAQRMRFTSTQSFLQPMKEFLRLGFGSYTNDKSAYNAAMSYNMKNAITGEFPDIAIDPSLVLVSMGKLPNSSWATVLQLHPQQLVFSWDTQITDATAQANDRAIAVLNRTDCKKASYRLDIAARRDGKLTIQANEFIGNFVACYLLFVRPKVMLGSFIEPDISDSLYCGVVQVDV